MANCYSLVNYQFFVQLVVMDMENEGHSDITFISECNFNEDHIDRALKNLKDIWQQNEAIRKEMELIKANPKAYIKPVRDEIVGKINQLRDQNDSLRRMVERAKAPAYTEMTKKKVIHHQNKKDMSPFRESMRSSYRHPLEEIDSNYDKNDGRSTCLNYGQGNRSRTQIQYVLEPTDQESRQAITQEIRLLLQRAEAFEGQLERINKKQGEELKKTEKAEKATQKELQVIASYKKQLVKLLNRLKNREIAMSELVKTYRAMHEETMNRLIQSSQTLENLRAAKISEDVDEKYAQVLELQQRLQFINQQLEEMDQSRWLQQISRELTNAVRRMGIQIPKASSLRELIDQLCEILIESHIVSRKDSQNKLNMLKHYHQEEKKNNSKYILGLKAKQQALGRRLIDIQMEK